MRRRPQCLHSVVRDVALGPLEEMILDHRIWRKDSSATRVTGNPSQECSGSYCKPVAGQSSEGVRACLPLAKTVPQAPTPHPYRRILIGTQCATEWLACRAWQDHQLWCGGLDGKPHLEARLNSTSSLQASRSSAEFAEAREPVRSKEEPEQTFRIIGCRMFGPDLRTADFPPARMSPRMGKNDCSSCCSGDRRPTHRGCKNKRTASGNPK